MFYSARCCVLVCSTVLSSPQEAHDPLLPHCRVIVAVEMRNCQGNKLWEFVGAPTFSEVIAMVTGCEWRDSLVELELWVKTAGAALRNHEYQMVSIGMGP